LDVTRDPRWGRVEETFGEDPYLVSRMGCAYIKGLQQGGVVATAKHFVGYGHSEGTQNSPHLTQHATFNILLKVGRIGHLCRWESES